MGGCICALIQERTGIHLVHRRHPRACSFQKHLLSPQCLLPKGTAQTDRQTDTHTETNTHTHTHTHADGEHAHASSTVALTSPILEEISPHPQALKPPQELSLRHRRMPQTYRDTQHRRCQEDAQQREQLLSFSSRLRALIKGCESCASQVVSRQPSAVEPQLISTRSCAGRHAPSRGKEVGNWRENRSREGHLRAGGTWSGERMGMS